jgi:hypothetical protein
VPSFVSFPSKSINRTIADFRHAIEQEGPIGHIQRVAGLLGRSVQIPNTTGNHPTNETMLTSRDATSNPPVAMPAEEFLHRRWKLPSSREYQRLCQAPQRAMPSGFVFGAGPPYYDFGISQHKTGSTLFPKRTDQKGHSQIVAGGVSAVIVRLPPFSEVQRGGTAVSA